MSTALFVNPHYLFESNALQILAASLFERLTLQNRMLVPVITSTKHFLYRDAGGVLPSDYFLFMLIFHLGRACFVCEFDSNSRAVGTVHTCPACPLNTPIDLAQGQQALNHNGAHILCDPSIDRATQPCGICLSPAPMCQFFLTTSGTKKIDAKRSQCAQSSVKFTYSIASNSTAASPCSNVPLNCTLCEPGTAAIWRYNFLEHLRVIHPAAPVEKIRSGPLRARPSVSGGTKI
jgi:hypothetical protein